MKAEQLNMSKKIYEPYLDLLRAICNSDDKKTYGNSCIVVYDTFENEKPIAVFSKAVDCARFFNTSAQVIKCNISRGNLRNYRYKIERVYFKRDSDENTIK